MMQSNFHATPAKSIAQSQYRAWMPLYIGESLAETSHLQAGEHGGYLLLIMHYWRNGHLPEGDRQLALIAREPRAGWYVWGNEIEKFKRAA